MSNVPEQPQLAQSDLRKNSKFVRLMLGNLANDFGTGVVVSALTLLLLKAGHSGTMVGLVDAIELVLISLSGIIASSYADLGNKARQMVVAAAANSLALLGVAMLASEPDPSSALIALLVGIAGIGTGVYGAGSRGLLREIVDEHQIGTATALTMARAAFAAVMGPILGALFFTISEPLPFALDALSFVLAGLTVWSIGSQSPSRRSRAVSHKDTTDGIRLLMKSKPLRSITLLGTVLSFSATGYIMTLAIQAGDRGTHATGVGILYSCFAVGIIIGSLATDRFKGMPLIALLVGAPVLMGVSLISGAWTYGWIRYGLTCLAAIFLPVVSSATARIQVAETPLEMQARIATLESATTELLTAPAPMLAGIGYDLWGSRATAGVFASSIVLYSLFRSKPELKFINARRCGGG